MDKILEFYETYQARVIITASIVGATFLLLFIISFMVNRFNRRQHKRRINTLVKLIQSIIRFIIIIAMIIAILGVWGFDVGPILAGAGILGLVVGFGAQSTIRDMLAGVSIVFGNYYDVDDIVEINGFKGRVIEIGLKATRIVNWKGEVKIFSNGDISEATNFSKNPSIGVVDIEVAYRENVNKVISLLEEKIGVIKDLFPQVVEGPNIVGVTKLALGGYVIRIIVKTLSEEHYAVERGINKYVKELFQENNIEIPFNRTVMYNDKNNNKL